MVRSPLASSTLLGVKVGVPGVLAGVLLLFRGVKLKAMPAEQQGTSARERHLAACDGRGVWVLGWSLIALQSVKLNAIPAWEQMFATQPVS